MAVTLRYTIANPCPAGDHYTVVAVVNTTVQGDIPIPLKPHGGGFHEPPTQEEYRSALAVIFRVLARQLQGQPKAAARQALEAKVVDLSVSVV